MLFVWIEDCNNNLKFPLSQALIQEKALRIFEKLKEESEENVTIEFLASRGWFERFKFRTGIRISQMSGEAASADSEEAKSFPYELSKIINEKGYKLEQIFNVDETALFWKTLPTKTFLASHESSIPGYKASKDRITILRIVILSLEAL